MPARSSTLGSAPRAAALSQAPAGTLASALDGVRDAFLIVDREWRVAYANAAARDLAAPARRPVVGRTFWDAFPAAGQTERAAYFRRAMDERVPTTFEAQAGPADRWFEKRVFPVDEGIAVIVEDVSERRRGAAELQEATERLRRSEALFRSITEHSAELTTIVGMDGRVQYVTPAGAAMLGRAPAELVGRHVAAFTHPDDLPAMAGAFERLMAAPGAPVDLRARLRHADGSWRTLEGRGRNLLDDPAVRGIVSTARDITAQAAIGYELGMRARLLDAVEQAVIATDLDGRITYWNRFAQSLYGWRGDEVLGHPAAAAVPVQAAKLSDPEIRRTLNAGASWSGELELLRRDGSRFVARVDCSPINDPDGRPVGVVCVSSDLTDRRMLEEQLRVTQKLEAIGSLAGGVAHDFNNILTAITSYSEMLLDALIPGDPARSDVQEIHQAARRAASLTRQLLAFSRHQVLQPRAMRLDETVRGMEGMLRRLIGEDIALRVESAETPLGVMADPGQVEQVVMNLVVNARDAMPHGGALTIGLRRAPVTEAFARARGVDVVPGHYVVLTVQDTGEGMSAEVRERAFEPFFTTKPKGKGTGLGLATVYGIVRQSQGFLTLDSAEGRGTMFEVYLPELRRDAEPATFDAARLAPAKTTGTILLVEDEEGVRAVARRVLEREGHTVVWADSGAAGLEILRARGREFDLVLTDLVMPKMGGREMVDTMRGMGLDPVVLFMSGYTEDEIARREPCDAVGWIEKPFTVEELRSRIQAALAARPVRAGAAP